ncbi:hypothetical protein [Sphingomonas oryzagri]|jgi:hypothetical protein|uniref:DUF5681 domain-containing protein n=1 Tax=Sphingomonas oryzagri TaxID=3042314 RepID=A0ABT6N2L3_9SPHN|nr:hypothetical protein [Sphingomonas oryzagri]MDH7639018.1 hypothetical protein [Sphingomonas oryzagri]
MARGSYLGGGTIIGFGARWSDWTDFPRPEYRAAAPFKKKKNKKKHAVTISGPSGDSVFTKKMRAANNRSKELNLTQHELILQLGVEKDTPKLKAKQKMLRRGEILKNLVRDGILLATGLPNPDHPIVQAIADRLSATRRLQDSRKV